MPSLLELRAKKRESVWQSVERSRAGERLMPDPERVMRVVEPPAREIPLIAVDATKYADYQNARSASRAARGMGHWARCALELHCELFYARTAQGTRLVPHPLPRGTHGA